tara:strand:- start:335 stop:928 length:594 start_codon:yes stop_codon:yes gene_type:complete
VRNTIRNGSAPLGLTLIELMAVLAIMTALLTMGIPLFQATVKNNRLQAETLALRAILTNARTEALARRMPVTVCESADGESCATDAATWSTGYIAFADQDNDRVVDDSEDVFLVRSVDAPGITLAFDGSGSDSHLRFSPRGDSLNFSGTFILCDNRGDREARGLLLANSGAVTVATDRDSPANDIIDDLGGDDVSCP